MSGCHQDAGVEPPLEDLLADPASTRLICRASSLRFANACCPLIATPLRIDRKPPDRIALARRAC
jgi:hypothetical protein